MIRKNILYIIIISILINCGYEITDRTNERRLEKEKSQLGLLLMLSQSMSNDSLINFPDYDYSFSVERIETVGNESLTLCIDIYKNKTLDQEKVITRYDDDTLRNKCQRENRNHFVCMTDITTYTSFHYFNRSIVDNPDMLDYCRTELEGVWVFK